MNNHLPHKNGWRHIELWLEKAGKNQSDLARVLNMSPAAITQIKNGQFTLNPDFFDTIFFWLRVPVAERKKFYAEIIQARISVTEFTVTLQ